MDFLLRLYVTITCGAFYCLRDFTYVSYATHTVPHMYDWWYGCAWIEVSERRCDEMRDG